MSEKILLLKVSERQVSVGPSLQVQVLYLVFAGRAWPGREIMRSKFIERAAQPEPLSHREPNTIVIPLTGVRR